MPPSRSNKVFHLEPRPKPSHPEMRLSMGVNMIENAVLDLAESTFSTSDFIKAKLTIYPASGLKTARNIYIRQCDWLDWRSFIQKRSLRAKNLR